MTNKTNFAFGVILVVVLVFNAFLVFNRTNPLGSVSVGSSYNSTTTRSTSASPTFSWVACSSGATIGNLSVNQVATAGYVQLWDATSTATSTYQTTNTSDPTTLLTKGKPIAKVLGTSDAATSLIYDSNTYAGLVVETSSGFDGEYTISYRCN